MRTFLKRLDERCGLMGRMAETTTSGGLAEALCTGRLSGEGLRGALLSCAACRHARECVQWLEGQERAGASAPPDYCRNGALFRRLAEPA